jgi:pyruvate kinase
MDVKVGQSLSIDGGRIVLTVEEKSGQRVKLRFVHDGVTVERGVSSSDSTPQQSGAKQALRGIKVAA